LLVINYLSTIFSAYFPPCFSLYIPIVKVDIKTVKIICCLLLHGIYFVPILLSDYLFFDLLKDLPKCYKRYGG